MAYLIIHTAIPGLFGIFAIIYFLVLRKWANSVPIEDDDGGEDDMDMNEDDKMDWKIGVAIILGV